MPFSKEDEQKLVALRPQLLKYCRSLYRNGCAADAEDLCQTALTRAFLSAENFKTGTNMAAWLTTIARNQFLTEMRRHKYSAAFNTAATSNNLLPPCNTPQEAALELEQLIETLDSFPADRREALVMTALGYSYEDVARKQDIELGTVKSRLSRGRAQLEERFSKIPQHIVVS